MRFIFRHPVLTMLLVCGLLIAPSVCAEERSRPQSYEQDIVFRFKGSVWVVDRDGENQRRLTTTEECSFPFWLPGGRQITFFSRQDGQERCYVVNGDGTGKMEQFTPRVEKFAAVRTAVKSASLHLGMPDLSPDKTRILFRNVEQIGPEGPGDEEILDLFVINVDGTHLRQLTNDVTDEYQARWSPDGTKIVFDSVVGDGNWNIFVMNADGSSRRQLTDNKAHYSRPVWSPDGTKIAFNSNLRGPGIYVMDFDGKNLRQLTGRPGDNVAGGHPDWYVRPYVFPNWPDYQWPR